MRDTIYFISDLHLGAGTPSEEEKKKEKFIQFLQLVRQNGQTLYIVGDLFDFWFEYKNAIPKTEVEILVALKNLTLMNLPVVYLVGNHDFWQRDFFPKYLGVKVEKRDVALNHEGKKVFITHGDGKARSDWGYRIIRGLFRLPLNVWLYRLLPVDWAFPLARLVSGSSRRVTEAKGKEQLSEYEDFAGRKFAEGFDAVILAHSHWPELKAVNGKTLLNIGDFMHHFTYGVLKGKEFQLLKLE
ncbi:MAG TPA: UDP-2,3-diacylglucosamine diphosphatase [candidate division Zixibacteria bacterium]|nr:UDP-2,3-diacylglucosamine diphosphatase [candidate division Zixibacteria bacterium]